MKANLNCIQCLQEQALHATQLIDGSKELQEQVLRQVMSRLLTLSWTLTPIELAQHVHRIVRTITQHEDPYQTVKKTSNDFVLQFYPALVSMIDQSQDPLLTAIKLMIAGNIIDYGAFRTVNIQQTIFDVFDKKLAIDDYRTLVSQVKQANTLLFFADNAGEIVFDKFFLETLLNKKRFQQITVVVKGGPMINDATLDDVQYVGLDKLPNIQFKTLSNGERGTGPTITSSEIRRWIRSYDLVIVKGQGNYEGLSDVHGIFFALIVKCAVVASDLGVNIHDIVFKYNA